METSRKGFSPSVILSISLLTSALAWPQAIPQQLGETNAVQKATPTDLSCETSDNLEVLSDTMGVDFGPYLNRIVQNVRENWYKLIPQEARPPILKEGRVMIQFAIMKDGTVAGIQLHSGSGDVELDRAAWGGITASNPFPPLPAEFNGQYIALRFHFVYNASFTITPSEVLRLAPGASQQFVAHDKAAKDAVMRWTISGKECEKVDCGTISTSGLYTAPSSVNAQLVLKVTATEQSPTKVACRSFRVVPPEKVADKPSSH